MIDDVVRLISHLYGSRSRLQLTDINCYGSNRWSVI